jgi:glycosyl transferase family 25
MKSLVKTYILNLPSAQKRREFQIQQALNLELDAVFIDARTPADIPNEFFLAHAFSWERPLKVTEVACFMSHHSVWDILAKGDEPALILEDDAILASQLPALLKWLSGLNLLDHVSLESRQRKKLLGLRSIPNAELQVSLQPLLQDRTGAAAYVLWPAGARILLNKFMQQGMGLADAFISSTYQLRSWQTVPAMAIQADMATSYGLPCPMPSHSLIAREKVPSPPTRGFRHDLRLKYRRLMSQLRLAIRFLSYFWRARRQYVDIDSQTF